MIPLDPFQVDGVRFLSSATSKGVLLADEPGVGKTRQAIAAAISPGMSKWDEIAVFCPASALPMWRRETRLHAPDYKWLIVQYNLAHLVDPESLRGEVVILDEAHYLKTSGSGRTADVFGSETDGIGGLIEHASLVICLTGTPTPNNPSEIWAMARACFPEAITKTYKDGTRRPMNFWQFALRYCNVETNYLGQHKIKAGGKRIAELRERLAPYVLRRLKKDVYKDLAAPRHSVLPIEGKLDESVHAIEGNEIARLCVTLREKEVEGLADISTHCATLRRLTGMAKVKGCADWIDDWFKGGGGPLVVFAYHKDVLRALSNDLARRKIRAVTGAPGVDVLFQDDPTIQVFLGQIQRDGVVITLTRAQTVLMVEQSWVPSENEQPWQRVHRRGQKGLVDVRWAALEGSIDEDVAEAWARKQRTISALWDSAA